MPPGLSQDLFEHLTLAKLGCRSAASLRILNLAEDFVDNTS